MREGAERAPLPEPEVRRRRGQSGLNAGKERRRGSCSCRRLRLLFCRLSLAPSTPDQQQPFGSGWAASPWGRSPLLQSASGEAKRRTDSGACVTRKETLKAMETELGPPYAVQPACCQEVPGSAPSEAFAMPARISGKIPPVRPCFKKKDVQKLLDTGALRALRPIITTLLGSGALDAFLRRRGQKSNRSNLHESVVKKVLGIAAPCTQPDSSMAVLVAGTSDVQGQISGGSPDQEAQTGEQSFPSVTSSASEPFQDHSLHAASSDAAAFLSCPDKILEGYPVVLQDNNNSFMGQCHLNPADKFGDGLFQDKSEEASLDLVFELLNQLQYHTHQKDGVDICVDFLQGVCLLGSDCPRHHTVLPYHWQVRRTATQVWQSVTTDSQEQMERLYCNPDNDKVKMRYRGHEFLVDLNGLALYDTTEFDQLRRLSTPVCTSSNSNYYTIWKYFCRDHFGWREYSEPVVRLIEEANYRGLAEVRFVTWHNRYVLNIKDGFQQNSCIRREIKRRPFFRSCVILMPYLQTLGGSPTVPVGPTTDSQVLSPTAVTSPNFYPETWVSMDPAQDFVQVPVSKEDKSYRTIYNLFHKTVPETKYKILKILRVQNQFLWEKYKRKKEYMCKKMTGLDRIMNERHLFHGTSQDVVDGICKHNFDPRVCGKHATMFGQGSYFARKASYSHNFSKRSPKGIHYMFLAKVLTGRYTVGNHTMRRPPPVNPNSITSDLYDSCVDNYFEPQIFVIFNDDQSYPYFVIQYEEVSNVVVI
ncbi:protein mono-ADP-ribosyltransferase TIPARP isoform X1 [Podarcis raffonei]|uniref:protein mono-ADP-ribosyltransferase TIPARP isoform X1 n=2 Tax=Podarcis raffonei TaxID=65483 RepID=UPI0023291950|nr:protein mono-ADP-ribosyltransferase TIPARP isoform X1 [Podarcis raffonei]